MKSRIHMMCRFAAGPALILLGACESGDTPTQPSLKSAPVAAPAVESNTWVIKAPLPTGRLWPAAGVANRAPGQPLLYVIGGEEIGDVATKAVEAYDFGTGTWSTKASLPIG